MLSPDLRAAIQDRDGPCGPLQEFLAALGMRLHVQAGDDAAPGEVPAGDGPAAASACVSFRGDSQGCLIVCGPSEPKARLAAAFGAELLSRDLHRQHQLSDLSRALVESYKELSIYARLQETVAVRRPLRQTLELAIHLAVQWTEADFGEIRTSSGNGLGEGLSIRWPRETPDGDPAVAELAEVVLATCEPMLHHAAEAEVVDVPGQPRWRWGALLGVPVLYQGVPRGLLLLARRSATRPFTTIEQRFTGTLANQIAIALENARLLARNQGVFLSTIMAMADAIEKRDYYTGGHTRRVAELSMLLADRVGLSPRLRCALYVGAMLHDIGKIGVDDAILRKQGRLTDEEYQRMKQHPVIGYSILANITELAPALPVVRSHHERYDGKGYPDGLVGKAASILARIVAIADTVDAMTSDRSYRKGRPLEDARAEIRRCSGSQFDPELTRAFLDIPPESLLEVIQRGAPAADRGRDMLSQIDLSEMLAEGISPPDPAPVSAAAEAAPLEVACPAT